MVKLEKPKKRGSAASWGRRGRPGPSPRCSPASRLVWASFPGGERGDSAGGEGSPEPARRRGGAHSARARDVRPPARPSRPRPAGPRRSGCALGTRALPPPGKPAPGRSSGRRAGPSAGAAPSRGAAQLGRSEPPQRRPLSGAERSCRPRRAHLAAGTCARTRRREVGGAGGGRGGAEAPERVPEATPLGSPAPCAAEVHRGRENLEIPRARAAAGEAGRWAQRCSAGRVWELQGRPVCLRASRSRVAHSGAWESLADVGGWRPLN